MSEVDSSSNVLTIRDLSIDYQTDRGVLKAMRHVNLDIPRGSIVGVVGESGCGKSTLISSIIRLLAPNAQVPNGSIEFEGQDLLQLSADQMRALRGTKLSIVFQDPMSTLNPVFSIGRQMTDIQYRDKKSMAEKRQRSIDMLASVGIPDPASRLDQFPHEFSGYRGVDDDAVRASFEADWRVALDGVPGLRIPNMLDEAMAGTFRAMFIQGEDIAQSDPNTQHVEAALRALDCVIVQDLFLNETARFAHVFLPGTSFLEKDGTFINAERRLGRVRPVMTPATGMDEWAVAMRLSQAMGYDMRYDDSAAILDEIARLTPTFAGVSHRRLDDEGSVQWPCNEAAPDGTPIMHVDGFVRGEGQFMLTRYVPTDERTNRRFPLVLTTGRM